MCLCESVEHVRDKEWPRGVPKKADESLYFFLIFDLDIGNRIFIQIKYAACHKSWFSFTIGPKSVKWIYKPYALEDISRYL